MTMTDKELLCSIKTRIADAKRNSKARTGARGRFNLTVSAVKTIFQMQNGRCLVTGIAFTPVVQGNDRKETNPWTTFSIDRIDNNKGYTQDNIRLVTNALNIARRDRSIELSKKHWEDFKKVMKELL